MKQKDWQTMKTKDKAFVLMAIGKNLDYDYLIKNLPVLDCFIDRAFQAKLAGHEHFSARTILEVMRWETSVKEKDAGFKLNNNRTPLLSYITMRLFPELDGFFRVRGM